MKNIKKLYPMIKSLHMGSKAGRNAEERMEALINCGDRIFMTSFVHSFFFLMEFPLWVLLHIFNEKKPSESFPVMELCGVEKNPIMGGRGSWDTAKGKKRLLYVLFESLKEFT